MRNGDIFIKKFNELEDVLRQKFGPGPDNHVTFFELVEMVAQKDVVVRRRKSILKSMGNLRNAIVHGRDYPEKILADPRDEIVQELKQLCDEIAKPEKLIPRFQKKLRVFEEDESLGECLSFMKENDFSQVVVKSGEEYTLLSSEGVVKWLEKSREIGLADLEEATIKDALRFEDSKSCRYLGRNLPIDEAIETFEKAISQGIPRLQAILITGTGKPNEPPLGIVTPWDLLSLP